MCAKGRSSTIVEDMERGLEVYASLHNMERTMFKSRASTFPNSTKSLPSAKEGTKIQRRSLLERPTSLMLEFSYFPQQPHIHFTP